MLVPCLPCQSPTQNVSGEAVSFGSQEPGSYLCLQASMLIQIQIYLTPLSPKTHFSPLPTCGLRSSSSALLS